MLRLRITRDRGKTRMFPAVPEFFIEICGIFFLSKRCLSVVEEKENDIE